MATRLRIRALLSEQGVTGYALHQRSGGRISLSTASRLARGEGAALRLELIDALCDVLGVEPGDLYERDGAPPRRPREAAQRVVMPVEGEYVRAAERPPEARPAVRKRRA